MIENALRKIKEFRIEKLLNEGRHFWVVDIFLLYIVIIVAITLIFRQPFEGVHLKLEPFWSYKELDNQLWQIVDNIILFIPYGVLGCLIFRCKKYVLLSAFAFTVITELLQWITKRGLCETDDVIDNMIGCLIGIGLVYLAMKISRRVL